MSHEEVRGDFWVSVLLGVLWRSGGVGVWECHLKWESESQTKYCTYGLYAMYLQPNLLGTKSRDLILTPS